MADEGVKLSPEQVRFLEKQNPQFRGRHVESSRPGELLCQDTFYVGRLKGVGKVYLHAIVDSYSSYRFVAEPIVRLPAHLEAARGRRCRATQRGAAVLREAPDRGRGRADRQWDRVLREAGAPLRTLPRALRDRAPSDEGRPPADERVRGALPTHGAGGVLRGGLAAEALRVGGGASGGLEYGWSTTTGSARTKATATWVGAPTTRSSSTSNLSRMLPKSTGNDLLPAIHPVGARESGLFSRYSSTN